MKVIFPSAMILPGPVGIVTHRTRVNWREIQRVRVNHMADCVQKIELCIPQNNDRTFQLFDSNTTDFSTATQVAFVIYDRPGSGTTALLTKTLTGGHITLLNPYTLQFDISNSESGAFSPGVYYCEVSIVIPGSEQYTIGAGPFEVQDTRYFD